MDKNVVIRDIDRGFKRLLKMKSKLPKGVQAGITSDKVNDKGENLAKIATTNEYGDPSRKIPERPFMRLTFEENKEDFYAKLQKFIKNYSKNRMLDPNKFFKTLGLFMQTKIQKKTTQSSQWAVANAPSTIAAKGSSKPLIDTGRMRASVTNDIIK